MPNEIESLEPSLQSALDTMMLLSGILLGSSFFIFILYVLYSIGLYKMAKRQGYEDTAYFSFIPGLNLFVAGQLSNKYVFNALKGKMPFLLLASVFISMFFSLFIVVLFVLLLISLFYIYKIYTKNYILLTVLSIISLGMLVPFFIFFLRNKEMKIIDIVEDIDEEDIDEEDIDVEYIDEDYIDEDYIDEDYIYDESNNR